MWVLLFMEVWKKIEGFENYEVSNCGNIRRKIPLNDVEKIKTLYKSGISQRKIAKIYNVNQSVISRVINQKTYVKHV
jgi:predicted XRE-type DNA-binding protein